MAGFVLIHGAFRGGWWFERVTDALAGGGHVVAAPDLTGMGEGEVARPGDLVDLSAWIDDVDVAVDEVRAAGGAPVIVAGHSQGGLVIGAAQNVIADRADGLAYLDAPVPRDGERGVDLAGPRGDAPLPPPDMWIEPVALDSDSGLSGTDLEWANARLCATPVGPSLEAVEIDPGAELPAAHAFCSMTPPGSRRPSRASGFDAEGRDYQLWDEPHDVGIVAPGLVVDFLTVSQNGFDLADVDGQVGRARELAEVSLLSVGRRPSEVPHLVDGDRRGSGVVGVGVTALRVGTRRRHVVWRPQTRAGDPAPIAHSPSALDGCRHQRRGHAPP